MSITTTSPAKVEIRRRNLFGLVAAVTLATVAVTWVATNTDDGGSGSSGTQTHRVEPSAAGDDYVAGIEAASPEQLAAAFGNDYNFGKDPSAATPRAIEEHRLVDGVTWLTPEQ
jgi:hypothetical protein